MTHVKLNIEMTWIIQSASRKVEAIQLLLIASSDGKPNSSVYWPKLNTWSVPHFWVYLFVQGLLYWFVILRKPRWPTKTVRWVKIRVCLCSLGRGIFFFNLWNGFQTWKMATTASNMSKLRFEIVHFLFNDLNTTTTKCWRLWRLASKFEIHSKG